MTIRLKRVHEPASADDGLRVFVERYWPRDVSMDDAVLHTWLRDIAPTPQAIAGWAHKPERWSDFKERYWRELSDPELEEPIRDLRLQAKTGTLTLVYGSRNRRHNSARVLAEYLGVPIEQARPAPSTAMPVPVGRARAPLVSSMSPLSWLGMLFAMLSPILALVIIQFIVVYRMRAWAVLAVAFALYGGAITVRAAYQERRWVELQGGLPARGEDREPVWKITWQFVVPVLATIMVVIAFLGLAELLVFLGR